MNLAAWRLIAEGVTRDGVCCHSFPAHHGNGAALEFESALLLYGLVRRLQPQLVVETGTNFGMSAACLALALQDTWVDYQQKPRGVVVTIDVEDYPQNEALWQKVGVQDFIRKVVSDSRMAPVPSQPCQLLWLDADHDTQFVIDEYTHFAPALDPAGAWIGLHDTRLDVRMRPGVQQILSLARTDGRWASVQQVRFPNMRGLDLIQLAPEPW